MISGSMLEDLGSYHERQMISELEQENRLLRARNDRLEIESQKLRENSCRFPLCQTEEYQRGLAEQIKRELVGVQQEPVAQLTDREIEKTIEQTRRVNGFESESALIVLIARAIEKEVHARYFLRDQGCRNRFTSPQPAQRKLSVNDLDVKRLNHCMIAVRDWLGGGCDTNDIPRPEIAALVAFTDYGIKENT